MSKTTTPQQYEKLVALMSGKLDMATAYSKRSKEEVLAFWEEVRVELNSLGPPIKDGIAWKKVWIDWKCYIKKKLSSNKNEMMSTGGGYCRLQPISPLEEKVIQMTGLQTNMEGIRSTVDFGVGSEMEQTAGTSAMDISARSEGLVEEASSLAKRQQQGSKESTLSLLKDWTKYQEAFYADTKAFQDSMSKKYDEVATNLRRMNRNIEKLVDVTSKQLEEKQRHSKIKEELLKQKVEIKMKMLLKHDASFL